MFTAGYALSPYITQIRFVFKGLTQGKNVDQGCSESREPRRICGPTTEENLLPLKSLPMCLGA